MSFPRYPKYRESGVEWLGEVPEEWHVVPIKSIAQIVNGYPFDSKLFDAARGHELVRIRDLGANETETRYNGEFVESAAITADDVLIGMDGDFNVGRWHGRGRALLNQRMCCVRGRSVLLTRLLEYALPIPLQAINDTTFATTVKHLSSLEVERVAVALPFEERELRCIISMLDREIPRLDELIVEQQRLIEVLTEKSQAVISHAVTKGLNPDVPMKPSGVDWLGDIPGHWQPVSLARITMAKCDGPFGSGLKSDHYVETGVRVIRLQNIRAGRFDDTDAAYIEQSYFDRELSRHDVQAGDVLIAGLGDDNNAVGRACVAPTDVAPAMVKADCFRFRVDRELTCPKFVALQLTIGARADGGRLATGSTRSRIPLSTMSTRIVALPSVTEQEQIVEHVREQDARFDALRANTERAIALLHERRSALISAAVTGKIDVRGLTPTHANAAGAPG